MNDSFNLDLVLQYGSLPEVFLCANHIERPGNTTLLIEIKSSKQVTTHILKHLISIGSDFSTAKMICLSNDPYSKQFDSVATRTTWNCCI